MQSKAKTIEIYLASLAADQRAVMEELDSLVREVHPDAERSMKYGMPTYQIGTRMFACNAQKNYFSVYAEPAFVEKYKAQLKGLDIGKSCIRFAGREKLPRQGLRKILGDY